MSYSFGIKDGVRVKREGIYPWPCPADPSGTIELFRDDVLTYNRATRDYTLHTGVCRFGIKLTNEEVEPIGKAVTLQIL
jgi:hypothetical protein